MKGGNFVGDLAVKLAVIAFMVAATVGFLLSPYPINGHRLLPGPQIYQQEYAQYERPGKPFGYGSQAESTRISGKSGTFTQNAGSDQNEPQTRFDQYKYKKIIKDLQSQDGKKKVEIQIGDYTYRINNPDRLDHTELQDVLAEQMYYLIRQCDTDISDIAENLNLRANDIKNIKDHVFNNKHYLDRYIEPGEPIPYQRFDANLQQALAWKRFTIGNHTEDDLMWLKRERVKRKYELRLNLGYSEAHRLAETRFDGAPWGDEF